MTKLRALGAYIFAGGFTLGVKEHFEVLAHFEEGPYGVATARLNFPDLPIFVGPETWPVEDEAYRDLDLVYGNPPCAAWSRAGVKLHTERDWRTDPRVKCTRKHFGLLEALHPRCWVWESVEQTFKDGRELIDELARRAMARGYAVTLFVFDARYLDLPQRRKRFFFIAHKIKLTLDPPSWTTLTCDEVLRGINDVGEPYAGTIALAKRLGWLLPACEPGTDLRKTFDRVMAGREGELELNHLGQVKGRPGFLVRRCKAGDVAPTVMHELIHPTEDRFLTLRELGALCGFPGDFELAPPASSMNELSRGVMPPVAEYLARMIARACEVGEPVTEPNVMVVDYRHPPGSIYPEVLVEEVPGSPPERVAQAAGRSVAGAPTGDSNPAGATSSSASPRERPAVTPAAHRPVEPVIADASAAPDTSGPVFETSRVGAVTPPAARVGVPRPRPGVKRMAFLQVLIMMGRWTPAQMVTIVKHNWPESKASGADVSTQRAVLRSKGYTPPPTLRKPTEDLPW